MEKKTDSPVLRRYLKISLLVGLISGSLWGFLEACLIVTLKITDFQYVASHDLGGWEWAVEMAHPPTLFYGILIYGIAGSIWGLLWGLILSPLILPKKESGAGTDDLVATNIASYAPLILFVAFEILFKLTTGGFWKFSPLNLKSLFLIVGCLLASFLLFRPLRFLLLKTLNWKPTRHLMEPKRILGCLIGFCFLTFVVSFAPGAYYSVRHMGNKESPDASLQKKELAGSPNILLIVMDTVRQDHLSCYGYPRETTPNLDQLAGEGVLFKNAVSTAPWTLPSHASLFTGTFPSKHGAHAEHLFLDGKLVTMAEMLASFGYQTVGFSNNPWISDSAGMSRGFEVFKQTWMKNKGITEFILSQIFQHYLPTRYDDGAKETNRWVIRWLEKEYEPTEPFFIFINYMEAHMPTYPSPSYDLYLKEPLTLETRARIRDVGRNEFTFISGVAPLLESDFEVLIDLYDAEITYLDAKIGEIIETLRKKKLLDDTVVIVLSDHGENIGDHDHVGHHLCVYDSLLRIPLIIRYPKRFPQGEALSKPVQICDIFPTLMDILDVPDHSVKRGLQGKSFLDPKFQDSVDRYAISEYAHPFFQLKVIKNLNPAFDVSPFEQRLKAVQMGDYKYIWSSKGEDELYNLKKDPKEEENIAGAFPERLRELRAVLEEWIEAAESPTSPDLPAVKKFDRATEERLRSLGYIQ